MRGSESTVVSEGGWALYRAFDHVAVVCPQVC